MVITSSVLQECTSWCGRGAVEDSVPTIRLCSILQSCSEPRYWDVQGWAYSRISPPLLSHGLYLVSGSAFVKFFGVSGVQECMEGEGDPHSKVCSYNFIMTPYCSSVLYSVTHCHYNHHRGYGMTDVNSISHWLCPRRSLTKWKREKKTRDPRNKETRGICIYCRKEVSRSTLHCFRQGTW